MDFKAVSSEKDALCDTGKTGNPAGAVYPKIHKMAVVFHALYFRRVQTILVGVSWTR
jgi:hypothetical protein